MKNRIAGRIVYLVATLFVASATASAQRIALQKGTVIPVTLDQNLSSDHSRKGDSFTATVRPGYLNLPARTRIEGIVRSAIAKTTDRPGVLVLEFNRIVLPGGRRTPIDGSPVGLDAKSVTTGRGGRLVAKSGVKNKRLTYVGYGAGAGALVALLGGGKRIVEDAVIGGALGYLVGALEKGGQQRKNNVSLRKGTSLGVLLHQRSAVLR